mgnify:CR=1 FL=1
MSAIRSCRTPRGGAAVACAALLAMPWPAAHAAFEDPATAAWGGWARYTEGTIHQFWDVFGDDDGAPPLPGGSLPPNAPNPITDFTPDYSFGPLGGLDAITETSGRAFLTPNVYSFAFPTAFEMDIAGYGDVGLPVRVALQVKTLGTELDYGSVALGGVAPDSQTELSRTTAILFGSLSDVVETLFLWTLPAGQDSYDLTFAAAGSSLSLDKVSVDVAPVPLPLPAATTSLPSAGKRTTSTPLRRRRCRRWWA